MVRCLDMGERVRLGSRRRRLLNWFGLGPYQEREAGTDHSECFQLVFTGAAREQLHGVLDLGIVDRGGQTQRPPELIIRDVTPGQSECRIMCLVLGYLEYAAT